MFKEKISSEQTGTYLYDGVPLDGSWRKNRFQKTNNLNQISKEDGSVLDIKFVVDTLYKKEKYVIVNPKNERGIETIISLKCSQENGQTFYLPVEDDKTIIGVFRSAKKKIDKINEGEIDRVFKNTKEYQFNYNPSRKNLP